MTGVVKIAMGADIVQEIDVPRCPRSDFRETYRTEARRSESAPEERSNE